MDINRFTVKQCDGDIAELLKPYIDDGRSTKFGALLVKEVPASRQVLPPDHGGYNPLATLQATSYFAFKVHNAEGIYILNALTEDKPLEWWKQIKADASEGQYDTNLDFMNILRNGQRFEVQSVDQKDYHMALRKELGLKIWPFRRGSARGDPALQLAVAKTNCEYLNNPTISILNEGPIKVYTAVAKLHLIYYHHEGKPVRWIVVPPSQKQIFESRVRHAFNIVDELLCSQFVSHLSAWIDPAFLNLWGISYYDIQQKAGQVLFIFSGSYIWGHGTGFGIIERKHYATPAWKLDNNSFCSMQTDACQIANPDGVPVALSQEDIEAIEAASTEATWKPRIRKPTLPLNLSQHDFKVKAAAARESTFKGKKKRKPYNAEPGPESSPLFAESPESYIDPSLHKHILSNTEDNFYFSDGESGFSPLSPGFGHDTPQENNILRENIQKLSADRNYLYQRKETYKQRLYEREEYIRSLDDAAQHEAQLNPWKEAATKGYRVIQERDKRIAELEEELRTLKMAGSQ